jgi:TetR/AcrR family transcriptional repressor of nem operon
VGRKSDAKQRILTSAIGLMSERGYAGVGVDDILGDAGVGKSSFYHFFPSKERLGVEAVAEYARRAEDSLFAAAFSADVAPLDRPSELVKRLADALDAQSPVNGCLAGAVAAGEASADMRSAADGVFGRIERGFARAFAQAIADHDLMPSAPVANLASACVAYVYGLLLMARTRQSSKPLRDLGPLMSAIWRPYLA